ncbi:non-ribosomal peptide synthetase [Granulicella sp. dw_53]|uniref:non-ribosomal peptide synthetase n=1 Tax=Granulicella sp. dw_53 TaxID=2719792 RepID=UPI001BD2D3CE|nr:non-ribosomal peptide synthetase [Granulicella sp. dw_53]
MKANERYSYPLTTAQRGLYFSQKITPSANMNIAEAVEICGPIKPEIFRVALRQLVAEAEELRVRITEQDGKPKQEVLPFYKGDFPYIDMSREDDPRTAIEAWMKDELARPIDLANNPLWVSALLKAADDHYFWYHRANHIGVDGYGGGLIARRLAELYTALAEDREPIASSFCTVETLIAAETAYRDSERFQRDREYWHQQLAQLPEALTLSRSHRRHGLSSDLRRSVGHLSADTVRQLAELGKATAASLPQVLISLVAAYYQRVTCVTDLVFLMPVSGRINAALRRSLAPSVNAVPIRLYFTPEITAAELFSQVSRTVRQALRHQQYRYEDLRRDLGRIGQEQNIAWLGVNIEPFDYHLNFDGAATISHNLSNSSAEDLMVFMYDRGTDTGLRFDLDANPALYELDELDEHRRRLTRLIEQVLAKPDVPLRQLDILGDEERRRLLCDWNATASELQDTRLPAFVAHWAAVTPDAPAVVYENTVVSYRQLHNRSVRQARQLIASGVESGDIVAVALPRSEQLLIVLLAIMRTGAAYLPLDLDSPIERTMLVLDDASPILLIAPPQMHERFARRSLTLLRPEYIDPSLSTQEHEPDLSTSDGTAYVLYTSGSTGRPKGVEVTHRNLANFLEGMRYELMPTARDRFLAVTTVIFDIAGLELYLPLTVGARVVMAGSEAVHDPPALARLIRRSGATHMQATPSLWRILLASSDTKLEDVHVLVGGEALGAELAVRLKGMAARVTQFYGPTETTIWSTAFELGEIGAIAPPIGRPILNTQVYVLDEYRQPVVTGSTGELYIGGEGVAKGYLHRAKLNEERFLANPFSDNGGRMYRTGDLVRWIDGGLLEFIGRVDDQVKVNGHRVELGEIESLLLQHETVSEAAVTAHHDGGTVSLASYLVASNGMFIDIDSLRVFLAGRLPSYMMPDSFVVLDALPLTPNGKLDRKALPLPEWANRNIYVEPATPTEKKLAELWQQILKVGRVGLHDNFFELGGDSLNAAELAALFPTLFETELALGSLFEAPTVGALAALIDRLTSSDLVEPLSVMLPLRRVAHRPLFCIHPMIGVSLGFSALLRHLDPMIPVYGLQSRGLRGGVSLPSSIEEIATDYLTQIRRIQPEGPYRLIGRSLGGLLGHSIAAQMQAQGSEVELLSMIDSYLFASEENDRPPTGADEVKMALSFLGIDLVHENIPATLKELGEFLLRHDNARSIPQLEGVMRLSQEIIKSHPEFIKHLAAVMFNNLKLARQHVPCKIDVDVLYFSATEVTGDLDGILDRNPSAWRPFVGGVFQVHELACHHENVLDPVPAAEIGNILQQRLSLLDRQHMRRPSALQQEKEVIIPVYA